MFTTTPIRIGLAIALAAVCAEAAVATAEATVPGRNGRIVFTSGREGADDSAARIHLLSPAGLPPVTATALTPVIGGQSRHPSWSPDRTKVVFANGPFTGNPKTEEYDLYIWDVVKSELSPLDLNLNGDGKSSDHPAWSPDGTRIAFETQTVDNEVNREIAVKTIGTNRPPDILTNSNGTELKPAWSPDSQTLYYARQVANPPASNFDLFRQPAAGGTETGVAETPMVDEYQPALSADGTKLCFTRQSVPGDSSSAEIFSVGTPENPAPLTNVSNDATKGDINCVWSPNGRKIAYSNGTFNQGRLVMANSDGSSSIPTPLADDQGSNNFDGNADWAADGSPDCPDTTITTKPDTPVTIPLECTDTGPEYERSDPNGSFTKQPQNGTLSDDSPRTNPSTVKYTPNPGFTGTDTVEYTAFDDAGFGDDKGTVTVRVEAPAGPVVNDDGTNDGGVKDDPVVDNAGDRVAPVLSRVSLRPARLRIAPGSRIARKRSVLSFGSSEAGRMELRFTRVGKGRKYTRALRRDARAGSNRVRLNGRIGKRTMPAGRYRVSLTVRDAAGNKSKSVVRRLTVARAR